MSVNGMQITEVMVYPVKKNGNSKLSAFAKVVINDQFIIQGIRIFDGIHGPFISFPQDYKKEDGKYYDVCHPTTSELRKYINDEVVSEFALKTAQQKVA